MASDSQDGCTAIMSIAFLLAVFVGGGCWAWYRAGVQVEVYQRQGIEMTQWEVFVGAKTAERTINIK